MFRRWIRALEVSKLGRIYVQEMDQFEIVKLGRIYIQEMDQFEIVKLVRIYMFRRWISQKLLSQDGSICLGEESA